MVFYFSGTGNTRWAAEQLAAATGEKLLFIPDELNSACVYTLAEGERIGFCFPVHGWQPPHIVREFIRRITIKGVEGHYAYALCTCGDSTGLAVKMLTKELTRKGIDLQSAQSQFQLAVVSLLVDDYLDKSIQVLPGLLYLLTFTLRLVRIHKRQTDIALGHDERLNTLQGNALLCQLFCQHLHCKPCAVATGAQCVDIMTCSP